MREVNDYHIFFHPKIPVLRKEVNEAIKDGWQPLGGVYGFGGIWAQTMVKYWTPYPKPPEL